MAQFPCEADGFRYRGPGNRAYIVILDGGQRWENRPRLCPDHAWQLKELFSAVDGQVHYETPNQQPSTNCLVCAGPVAGRLPQSVFMTLFTGRDVREDFYAPICRDCRPAAEVALLGA